MYIIVYPISILVTSEILMKIEQKEKRSVSQRKQTDMNLND